MVLVPNFTASRFQGAQSYGPRLGVGRYPMQAPGAAVAESVPMMPQTAPAPAPMQAPQVQVGAITPGMGMDGSDQAPGMASDDNFGVDAGADLGMSFGQFATNSLGGMGLVGPMGLGMLGAALVASSISGNPPSFGLYSAATGRSPLQDLAAMISGGGGGADGANYGGMDAFGQPTADLGNIDAAIAAQADRGGITAGTYSDLGGAWGGAGAEGAMGGAANNGNAAGSMSDGMGSNAGGDNPGW